MFLISSLNSENFKTFIFFGNWLFKIGWKLFEFLISSITLSSRNDPTKKTSFELSAQGTEKADPIAPAPIITIFFINYTYLKTNIAKIEDNNVAIQRLKSVRPSQAKWINAALNNDTKSLSPLVVFRVSIPFLGLPPGSFFPRNT